MQFHLVQYFSFSIVMFNSSSVILLQTISINLAIKVFLVKFSLVQYQKAIRRDGWLAELCHGILPHQLVDLGISGRPRHPRFYPTRSSRGFHYALFWWWGYVSVALCLIYQTIICSGCSFYSTHIWPHLRLIPTGLTFYIFPGWIFANKTRVFLFWENQQD